MQEFLETALFISVDHVENDRTGDDEMGAVFQLLLVRQRRPLDEGVDPVQVEGVRPRFDDALDERPELGLDVAHPFHGHVLEIDADGGLREQVRVDVHVRGEGLVRIDKGLHHGADLG